MLMRESTSLASGSVRTNAAETVEAELLAFVEQQSDGPQRRRGFEDRTDFDQRRDPEAVVCCARAGRRAVVMGIEQQTASPVPRPGIVAITLRTREQLTMRGLRKCAAIDRFVHWRLAARWARSSASEAAAHRIVCSRINGVRPLVAEDALQAVRLRGWCRILLARHSSGILGGAINAPSGAKPSMEQALTTSMARSQSRRIIAIRSPPSARIVTASLALTIARRRRPPRRPPVGQGSKQNGLSGRGRRGDGQCRARDPEHPRRAPIPARRSRGRRVRRARPAT